MKKYIFISIVFISFITACATSDKSKRVEPELVEDIIPVTAANMRGHKALYEEGWYVITSSEKALSYAHDKSVISSREAIVATAHSIASRDDSLGDNLSSHWGFSFDVGKDTFDTGTRITKNIFSSTSGLSRLQVDYSKKSFQKSWEKLIKGNLALGKRTGETRDTLINQPGNYYKNLKEDFSNIYELTSKIQSDSSFEIGKTWNTAFSDAARSFEQEYEKSGESSNTIGGLLHVMAGYVKGLYQGLFKPGASTVAYGVSEGARGAAQVVFLPAATAISVSGRTIQSIGTTVFYTGKLGIEIISPTVEAGLLSGMAILSLGTGSVTYVTGTGVGTVNQVAFTAAAPVVGGSSGVALTAAETGKYVAFVSYDAVVGTSKVVINQASAAVVLGYNALTALPTHMLMGVLDGAVFIAYDGPRLVIAYAKGEVQTDDGVSTQVNELPVGTVVDLEELKKRGIEVEVLSDDPEVIKDVIERLPDDLRE